MARKKHIKTITIRKTRHIKLTSIREMTQKERDRLTALTAEAIEEVARVGEELPKSKEWVAYPSNRGVVRAFRFGREERLFSLFYERCSVLRKDSSSTFFFGISTLLWNIEACAYLMDDSIDLLPLKVRALDAAVLCGHIIKMQQSIEDNDYREYFHDD